MKIRAPYDHGSIFICGREIYFSNGEANVPDDIGNELIKKSGYSSAKIGRASCRERV